jgi:putative ABC transport system ATP-binding protein
VTLDGGGPMLHVTGLRKSFPTPAGPHLVLDGVDLTVAPGEVIAIGGRSGSGKTTLLTIIAGWEELDDGSVVFDDTIVPAAPRTSPFHCGSTPTHRRMTRST